MSHSPKFNRPNIWSMAVVHQYYRREFELAPRIVRDLAAGQQERFEAAKSWLTTTLAMMHHHHVTEDEMMYPLLEGRVDQELLDRMDAQHQFVADAVDRIETLLLPWTLDDRASGEALAEALDDMLPGLNDHLDAEENEVMPLVADLLTAEEYGRQGTSGNHMTDLPMMLTVFGAMAEQATDDEAAVMLSHPTEQVRTAWLEYGAGDYAALMRLLRADLQPIPRHGPIIDVWTNQPVTMPEAG